MSENNDLFDVKEAIKANLDNLTVDELVCLYDQMARLFNASHQGGSKRLVRIVSEMPREQAIAIGRSGRISVTLQDLLDSCAPMEPNRLRDGTQNLAGCDFYADARRVDTGGAHNT